MMHINHPIINIFEEKCPSPFQEGFWVYCYFHFIFNQQMVEVYETKGGCFFVFLWHLLFIVLVGWLILHLPVLGWDIMGSEPDPLPF